jgi:hypothetical protein
LQQSGGTPPLDIHTLEPELAWQAPEHRIFNYFVPRCRAQVRCLSDKRAKKFLVCVGLLLRSCAYKRNTIIGSLGTGAPRGDLSGCVRPRDTLSVVQHGRGRPRFMHMFPVPFHWAKKAGAAATPRIQFWGSMEPFRCESSATGVWLELSGRTPPPGCLPPGPASQRGFFGSSSAVNLKCLIGFLLGVGAAGFVLDT